MEQSSPLSLQAVLQVVQGVFDMSLTERSFWCQAEVLHAKAHRGRIYLDLIDYTATGTVAAKARGIVRDEALLTHYLQVAGIGTLEQLPGKVIMFQGTCRFHQQRGLSITILELAHEFGRGQLVQQQAALRQQLQQAGLYGRNQQLDFLPGPVRLAVISSPNSQGLEDFMTVLEESERQVMTELVPAAIHGDAARQEVVAALERIRAQQPYTAVVIVRGGGGGEGLLRQNDEQIAHAVCTLPVPVILATGHTSDTSLLDELVRHAAKTPTDAAWLILQQVAQQAATVETLYRAVTVRADGLLERVQRDLAARIQQIDQAVRQHVHQLTRQVTAYRDVITSYGPEQVLAKGYGLVCATTGRYLSHREVQELHSGDRVIVKTAGRELRLLLE